MASPAGIARLAARIRVDLPLAVLDGALAVSAFGAALALRSLDGDVPSDVWAQYIDVLPLVLAIVWISNLCWGLYGPIWRHASALEARRIVMASMLSTGLLAIVVAVGPRLLPLSVIGLGGLLYMVLAGALRFHSRLFALRRRETDAPGLHVVVLGAGEAGAALIREMQRDVRSGLVPVAVLDDDPRKHGRSCLGIRVHGGIDMLPSLVDTLNVHQSVLALGDPPIDLVRRCASLAEEAGIPLRVLPAVGEMVQGRVSLEDVRDLQIEDLLGRQQVATDLDAVRTLLRGRRVLITGAGGSIGSEIARQVAACEPAQLFVLDHDETHLHELCAGLTDSVADGRTVQLLADIREREVLMRLFERHRPEIVFHAAAHKHVPVLEQYPGEAVRTNVFGTANLIEAATSVGVERFVFISTDKAVNPSCVMGATKKLGEHLMLTASAMETKFCAVRFGNVLGSRGSVIPTFVRQINANGPVTLTHPLMTRFFMSIPEAVQLVLQAATMCEDGREIYVLDMGEQVSIYDLAHRMIRLAGRRVGEDIEIRVVGMRPGEKLAEELHTDDEELQPTAHPSVRRLVATEVCRRTLRDGISRLRVHTAEGNDAAARAEVYRLAGTSVLKNDAHYDAERPRILVPGPASEPALPSTIPVSVPESSTYDQPLEIR